MHVGTGRTALFNWLYAKHTGGTFIVRIDDTDDERNAAEFEADILAGLRWLGLDWDEGVGVGGPHGTYRQSDRYERYRQVALELVEREAAYFCFCTPAELAKRREEAAAAGQPLSHDPDQRSDRPSGVGGGVGGAFQNAATGGHRVR
jgi:glutamyl/glutaminyl-tRNA synthetase